MRRTLITLSLCLISSSAYAQRDALIINVAGYVADLVSTEIAVSRPNVQEWNPILGQDRARCIVIKTTGAVATTYIIHKIGQRRPKLARVVGYSMGALMFGVAVHNARVGR